MKTNFYIPKKCKVGLQMREGTYTGKLGYVIYHDGKVWRKETSWEGWRHKEGQMTNKWDVATQQYTKDPITGVEPIEFDNVPTEILRLGYFDYEYIHEYHLYHLKFWSENKDELKSLKDSKKYNI